MLALSRVVPSLFAASLAIVAGTAVASDTTDRIKQVLEQRVPGVAVRQITASAVDGIYEVVTDTGIAYSDSTGEHLLLGRMMETSTGRNLSADRWDAYNEIEFASLPKQWAIKRVIGKGSRSIAIFADPDCPYCRELEHEIAKLDDLTVYLFLMPLESIHPEAKAKSIRIWCAREPGATWDNWMLHDTPIPEATCDPTPIADIRSFADKHRIGSTPTLVLSNGQRISGGLSAAELSKRLESVKR